MTPDLVRPIALTMGEPGGVGPELTLKAWINRRGNGRPFVFVGCAALLREASARFGLDIPVQTVQTSVEASTLFSRALPVLDMPLALDALPGLALPEHAAAVIACIERAVALARTGAAAAVVTNPIHKNAMHQAGFAYPGHTEFLEALAGPPHRAIMMLAGAGLRVVPVTIHQSLRSAVNDLTSEMIVETAIGAAVALHGDFGVERPRLAIAGLNPHAGENGDMGDEEIAIIRPAVDQLRSHGLNVEGPLSSDTMFTARARARYDAAICMYHDQALIPLKTLDMDGGVNITLGLPFVRTSPDHGTALDIAGSGIADPGSLIAALDMAGQIAAHRGRNA